MRLLPLGMLFLACAAQAADPLASGRQAFKRCANCHQVGPNAHSNFGPQLNGIVGRRAGTVPDFAYSPAMKKAGFIWDEKRLAAFIHDPDEVVPGTRMRFWGLMSDRQVRELVAYLRSFPAPAAPARR
ncbi:cytochrome c family protein [Massilia sp. 9I]|uniref:c-type cytochrome n=1 Tax=Massilia sp. 9I TaxID=2653152 RepID=UPI0012F0A165|nr:cytochrome c family protein [Massilia sp. 9I]VXB77825.1 Cytochrome c2 [Massilia sp. 9I]